MAKLNCWEFMKCTRVTGGEKASEMGVCPVAEEQKTDGIHGGIKGGRCCWMIAGTFCKGKPQGTFVQKIGDCLKCDFYKMVMYEEGLQAMDPEAIWDILDDIKAYEND